MKELTDGVQRIHPLTALHWNHSHYNMWLWQQHWRKNLMKMSIKVYIWVALVVPCLLNTTTINLFSVSKWICGKGGIERKNYLGFFNMFALVIASYKKPDHPLPPSKTTLAAQGSRAKKWLSNYCDWKSIQELCNTLQCSLAPFFHWKLPNEHISLNL